MIVSKFTNLNEWKLGRSHIVCKIVKMFIHPPCVTNQKVSAWTYVILFRHLFILNRKIETQVDGRIIFFVFINGTRVSIYIYIYISLFPPWFEDLHTYVTHFRTRICWDLSAMKNKPLLLHYSLESIRNHWTWRSVRQTWTHRVTWQAWVRSPSVRNISSCQMMTSKQIS